MAKITFRSDVNWAGHGVKSTATCGKHQFIIDEPPSLGGQDEGPNPVEFILASLGSCLNVLIAAFAPQHDVVLKELRTTVEGDLDPDGFLEKAPVRPGFQEVRYHIDIVSDSPTDRIARLVEHAQRVCPVKDTLGGVPVLHVTAATGASA